MKYSEYNNFQFNFNNSLSVKIETSNQEQSHSTRVYFHGIMDFRIQVYIHHHTYKSNNLRIPDPLCLVFPEIAQY